MPAVNVVARLMHEHGPDVPIPDRLKYNRLRITALCSPTRQAMLIGRNHHTAGGPTTTSHSFVHHSLVEGKFLLKW
jgi:hypothetical protein